jgi:hypothetical protein
MKDSTSKARRPLLSYLDMLAHSVLDFHTKLETAWEAS